MIKRNITWYPMVVITACLLVLSACGSGDEAAPTDDAAAATEDETASPADVPEGQRTIQLLTFNSPEQLQPLIDAWGVDHPDVAIEVQSVPFGELSAVIQSRVGGGDADVDVFLVDQPRLAGLAADGLLADLTDDVEITDGTVLPDALDAAMYDGRLYALPVQTSTQLLFYNPDLLEAAGVDIPTTDPDDRLTWEAGRRSRHSGPSRRGGLGDRVRTGRYPIPVASTASVSRWGTRPDRRRHAHPGAHDGTLDRSDDLVE